MDRTLSSIKDETSTSQSSRDKSVSELLSSYYSISDSSHKQSDTHNNLKSSKTARSTTVTDKDFLSHTFDVEFHLDNILTNNSISDAISFLRKLERETRQLTAGKQLLIYDNYECLFSALDTIKGINRDLDSVETNLRNLSASQIKAASKDITSKYGIRDKFLQISQLSKAADVFKFLANLCNTLASFNNSNTIFYSNDDQSSKVLKCSPKDVLYFCSKVYYIFKYFDSEYQFLFSNYYGIFTELVSRNTISLISDHEPLYSEDLFDLCKSLQQLAFDEHQLVEFYFYNLSSLLENKMKNLFVNYTNDDLSFTNLCKEVFESLLSVVYESVSNEKFVTFLNTLDLSTKRKTFCFYCIDELKVDFYRDSSSDLFTSFSLVSSRECKCSNDSLASQFVLYYSQASFYIFMYLITAHTYQLVTKDVNKGLMGLFGRVYTLEAKNGNQSLLLDQSLNWIMITCVLYLQYLFFKLYDSVISKSISLLNGSYGADLNSYVLTSFEKLMQELVILNECVKDVGNSLKNNFDQVFNSLLATYTCGLKYIYHLIFVNINSIVYKSGDSSYLDSLSNLISLRSCTDKNRDQLIEDFLKQTAVRPSAVDNISQPFKNQNLFSVLEFMDRNVKSQLKKFKFDASHHKTYTRNLLSFLIKFDAVFGAVGGVLERSFKEAFKMFKESKSGVHLKINESEEFEELTMRMRDQVLHNTNYVKYRTIFDDILASGQMPLLNMLYLSHEYGRLNRSHFPLKVDEYELVGPDKGLLNSASGTVTGPHVSAISVKDEPTLGCVAGGPGVCVAASRTHSFEEHTHKTHFETFDVSVEEMANGVVSHIMYEYLDKSLKIIRYVLDNLEGGHDVIDDSIKDFTILLSDILQDVNILNMAQMSADVATQNKNLDKLLNSALTSSDLSPIVNVYNFKFNTSRDMCLKLFTMHIVQCLSQYKATYNVDENLLIKFYDGLKQQILIIFKKNLDLFVMQSAWEKVMNVS